MKESNILAVLSTDDMYKEAAKALSERLCVELLSAPSVKNDGRLILRFDENGLSLSGGGLSLHGDYTRMLPRIKPNNLNGELLIKAAKIKSCCASPTAVDATAGLGEDSFLLAAAGFKVLLYEYNPIIAALLRNALDRASNIPMLSEITARMQLFEEDSAAAMPKLIIPPDLILLDPMFPPRQKNALVKKKLQLIQQLERPCADEAKLLASALSAHPKRVIIKRPAKGAYLGDIKPSYTISGKSIRYDCIVLP